MREILHVDVVELAELSDVRIDQRPFIEIAVDFIQLPNPLSLNVIILLFLQPQVPQILQQNVLKILLVPLELGVFFKFASDPVRGFGWRLLQQPSSLLIQTIVCNRAAI